MFTATRYAEGVTIAESATESTFHYRRTRSNTKRKAAPSAAIASTASMVLQTPFCIPTA